jgi:hypothetical protein
MAWFNTPELPAGYFEVLGATFAYAIHGAATLRRIRELREKSCGAS